MLHLNYIIVLHMAKCYDWPSGTLSLVPQDSFDANVGHARDLETLCIGPILVIFESVL